MAYIGRRLHRWYSEKHAIGGIFRFPYPKIGKLNPFFSEKTSVKFRKKVQGYPAPIFFYGEKIYCPI